MKAMVLAAGLGTRLRPLTDRIPKPLIPIGGQALIAHTLQLLQRQGFSEVVVNLHHLGQQIIDELGDGKNLGLKIHYSWEPELLGTGGGIKKMRAFFDDNACVINGDILSDIDLAAAARWQQEHAADATLVLRPYPTATELAGMTPPTAFRLHHTGRILATLNAQTAAQLMLQPQEKLWMFTGAHVVRKQWLERLPDGPSCIFQNLYKPAIEAGEAIYGLPYSGYWRDLGTLAAYEHAQAEFISTNKSRNNCG